MSDDTVPRRKFLLGAGLAGTALAAGLSLEACRGTAASYPPRQLPPHRLRHVRTLRELDRVGSRLHRRCRVGHARFPADELLRPRAAIAGVAVFIDRQLGSAWEVAARKMYRAQVLALKGKPGARLSARSDTARIFLAAGIRRGQCLDAQDLGQGAEFPTGWHRPIALSALEGDGGRAGPRSRISRRAPSSSQLHGITMAGFFSDPIYGGNRDKAGWKVLGFPGLPATYADKIDAYRDKRYVADPQSIADFS